MLYKAIILFGAIIFLTSFVFIASGVLRELKGDKEANHKEDK